MRLWLWAVTSAVAAGVLATLMLRPDAIELAPLERTVFLPGVTTDGHYQIELACNACHESAFSDEASMQEACVGCHGAELERVDDSHPQRKFTDPRNAERVAALDARWCVTCHQEHRPEITTTMGLSLPVDYCHRCHETIGEERPTHAGLPFDSCASGGCHNFHDNQALYEDFLVEHRAEPDLRLDAVLPARDGSTWPRRTGLGSGGPLGADAADAPLDLPDRERWVAEWLGTSHAEAGVRCTECHAADGAAWSDRPGLEGCRRCHDAEADGFLGGRHGMRLAVGLPPMTPGAARRPMHPEAAERPLDCQSCHEAHAYDTRVAAAEACLGCHADEHSLAWQSSPHGRLWQAEREGRAPAGRGVSCATCHLPRLRRDPHPERTLVAHNQNDTLRPNEKMIRSSCMACHGLGFALNALADPALVATNFRGRPAREVESIHYAAVLRFELEGKTPPWQEEEDEE